jgi:aspartate/methionine/tyrosine aminotransferase
MSMSAKFNLTLPAGISPLRAFNSLASPQTINLGLGKPWEDMPAELRELVPRILKERLDYTENAGLLSVRRKVETHYGLGEATAILTHGAQEGIFASLLALLNPGDEVLIPDPGFLAYGPMVKMLGGKEKLYTLDRTQNSFSLNPDAILRLVGKKTKAVILNAPGNPVATPRPDLCVLLRALEKRGVYVLSDEVYGELAYDGAYGPLAQESKQVVSLNAFSKSHALTGWRIGWMATQNPDLFKRLLVAHQYISTCASVPAQRLVGELLDDRALFRSICERYRKEYKAKRDLLFSELGNAFGDLQLPEAGFYAFLPIPKKFSSSLSFAKKLLSEQDVLVIPGQFFGKQGHRFIRLSFAVPDEWIKRAAIALKSL